MKYFFALLILITSWSCKILQEKDLTNSEVILISPPDKFNSPVTYTTFHWSQVAGATQYRIQIATPSFAPDLMYLILDSVTAQISFSASLASKTKYEWRVAAINGAYESPYSKPRSFEIDSSGDISIQIINLKYPVGITTKQKQINFQWDKLDQADYYEFEIDSADTQIFKNSKINTSSASYTFKGEGSYTWRVRGNSSAGKSSAFASETFLIDLTSPVVRITSPVGGQIINSRRDSTVTLNWTSSDLPDNTQGVKTHRIYVYTDPAGTNLYNNYNGKLNPGFSEVLKLNQDFYDLYWKVLAEDHAGNISINPDSLRRITIRNEE